MDFKNFELSEFIRYILTGFNFLLFVILLPAIYLQPGLMKDVLVDSSFLLLGILSVAIGYLMDMLKVYQFTPRFTATKRRFYSDIARVLDISSHQASSYRSLASELVKRHGLYDIDRRRAEWVLMLHTGVTLIISSVVWGLILLYKVLQSGGSLSTIIPIFAIAVSIPCSLRLFRIAAHEREKSNRDFMIVLEKNKDLIMGSWSLKPLSGEDSKAESKIQIQNQR